jgi:hypothetical protein
VSPGVGNLRAAVWSASPTRSLLRIAVDLKLELFRNPAKLWSTNAIHEIDALSMAVPYCHIVVPDREMAILRAL